MSIDADIIQDDPTREMPEWEFLPAGRHLLNPEVGARWHVIFARVSTGEQVRDGGSLPQQIDGGLRLAQRKGQPITAIYVDPGKSATRLGFSQREGIRTLMDDIRAGRIATVLVYKRDRIARQSAEWLYFWKTCKKHGVAVEFTCPQEPPLGKGVYGKVQEAFMSLWAELESELISIRVKDSVASRYEKGEWIGGGLPFGLTKAANGRLIPQDGEAELVQEIFRLALEAKWGATRIARHLNQQHPKSRRGFPWTRAAVDKVLNNKLYCGVLTLRTTVDTESGPPTTVHLGKRVDSLPVVVSVADWDAVQAIRRSRTCVRGATPSPHAQSPNPLLGLVVCWECGGPLSARNQTNRQLRADGTQAAYRIQVYYCRRGQSGAGCTFRGCVRRETLERTALEACWAILGSLSPAEIADGVRQHTRNHQVSIKGSLALAKRELGVTTSALVRNRAALERSDDPQEVRFYQSRISELLVRHHAQGERVERLRAQLDRVTAAAANQRRPADGFEGFVERFYAAPDQLRRAFLSAGLRKLVYSHETRTLDVRLHGATEPDKEQVGR